MNRSFLVTALALVTFVTGCSAAADASSEAAQNLDESTPAPALPVLTDAAGFSLYTFDLDTTNDSTCYDGCATHWPASLVTAEQDVTAPFGTTTRHDGATQLTLDGHPLYRFAGDTAPGQTKGDGLGGVWHLAHPPTAPAPALTQTVTTDLGDVLADGTSGLSLYTFDPDTTSDSTCYDGCAVHWPPVIVAADAAASVTAPYGTTVRHDGALQLTFDGDPLYTFAGDSAEGDTNGDGLGGVWHLARPSAR